jgi:phosphoenolpyruvate synthase/pyruvate phosphate dikinase
MMTGVIDDQLQNALREKLEAEFVGNDGRPLVMRFRTSTNSEDLDAFPCAGCYESHTGDPSDWPDVLKAIRSAYSSAWLFRTFEERSYYRVDHKSVGMALLVHHRFDGEVANGVAITSNPYDSSGADSARYVNVEFGGAAEVVHLPSGVTTDQFLYFANGSTSYISRSNLVAKDQHVLSDAQIAELGSALDAVHQLFASAYKDPGSSWYAMDSEFKFIACDALGNPTDTPTLWIKQARPYPSPFAAVPAASSSGP